MMEFAIGFGLLLNLLAYELIGFTAGGVVVPGYMALFLDQPWRIASTFLAAGVTLVGVRFLSRFIILYGRRRFAAMLLVGFLVNGLFDVATLSLAELFTTVRADMRVIGFIVPGLIANEMHSQGVVPTVAVALGAALIVRLALFALQAGVAFGG